MNTNDLSLHSSVAVCRSLTSDETFITTFFLSIQQNRTLLHFLHIQVSQVIATVTDKTDIFPNLHFNMTQTQLLLKLANTLKENKWTDKCGCLN